MNLKNIPKYLTTLAFAGMLSVSSYAEENPYSDNVSKNYFGSEAIVVRMNSKKLILDLENYCHAEYKVNEGLKVDLRKPYFITCDTEHGTNLRKTEEGKVLANQVDRANRGLLDDLIHKEGFFIKTEGIHAIYPKSKRPDYGDVF